MLQMASILSVLTILMVPFSNQFQNDERDILNHFPNSNALSDEKEYAIAPIAQGCPSLEPDVDSIQNSPIVDHTHTKSLPLPNCTSILAKEDNSRPTRVRKKKVHDFEESQAALRDQKNHVNKVRKTAAAKAAAEFAAKALAVTLSSADSSAKPNKKQKTGGLITVMNLKNIAETRTRMPFDALLQFINALVSAGLKNSGQFAQISIYYLTLENLSMN